MKPFFPTSRKYRVGWLFPASFCLGLILPVASLAGSEPDYFPLSKGNFWIYEGDVSWVDRNPETLQNQVYHKHLTWRSEVTDVVPLDNGLVARLHGFPTDLDWYNSKTQPSDRLLLRLGTDYFEIREKASEVFQRIKDAKGNWTTCFQQIDASELFLPTPLANGKCFGGSPGNFLTQRYCNVVQDAAPFDPASVKGAPSLAQPVSYEISYRANPERYDMSIVPGLGITNYSYHHNGTTMEVDIQLIQFGHAP